RKKLNGVVVTPQAIVSDLKGKGSIPPHFLYYGTFVHISSKRGSNAVISAPDLSRWLIRGTQVKPLGYKLADKPTGARLVREAIRFLGVPYLWGGISPAGFDCSGLVRTICGRYGLYLPRDTKDQIGVGRHIERSEARTGDLLFFRRHVGFAIGSDKLIHASRGGSGVRINSLVAGEKDYRPDLDRDFQEARRVLK
ncbi:MAG: C40 family peptidase, partial [Candidatus Zixiibacteriota bacterium]